MGALGSNVGHEVIVVRPPGAGATASGPAVPLSLTEEPGAPGTPSGAPSTETPPTTTAAEPAAPPSGIPGLPFVAPGSEVFRISLLELQSGNPEKNITLRAGDTVYFPRAAQVYVMGSVARPGPYRYQEGMTVLQALTLAGGATERGSAGRAKVVRIVEREEGREEGEGHRPRPARGHAGRARAVLLTTTRPADPSSPDATGAPRGDRPTGRGSSG